MNARIIHIKSREEWLHPETYAPDYHPEAIELLRQRVSKQPYWQAWIDEHWTGMASGFLVGFAAVVVPCLVLAWWLA